MPFQTFNISVSPKGYGGIPPDCSVFQGGKGWCHLYSCTYIIKLPTFLKFWEKKLEFWKKSFTFKVCEALPKIHDWIGMYPYPPQCGIQK